MSAHRNSKIGKAWTAAITDLIRRTATELPDDIQEALRHAACDMEQSHLACDILQTMLKNTVLAGAAPSPICQDTGTLTFWIDTPVGADLMQIARYVSEAVATSTQLGYLRRNTIETLSGQSIDDNLAPGAPSIHFEQAEGRTDYRIWLLLKGGGCENVSAQYSLPDTSLNAGRDLQGVRACVLHALWRAQGLGCSPGVVGVCLGGDRAEGYLHAKRQLLRPLADSAPEPELAQLETQLLSEANTLGIGPMGLGGTTTLLGAKLAVRSRLPASYFVTIAYSCWACRRRGLVVAPDGTMKGWLG